ncbi:MULTISPECIES: ABC transporter permease [Rhizobium]|uniref:ABC transporter permease subunit n=1 Tax=Rhizobium rhododendri TaxID=2506430 RepID=A0ABY8IQN2_9HYPH|nr:MULTISPECIES: ABC transporter permease subunit [Rhizobium]WFS26024.1 ABC transporter permease subunit [Rhizobium rhododendri]
MAELSLQTTQSPQATPTVAVVGLLARTRRLPVAAFLLLVLTIAYIMVPMLAVFFYGVATRWSTSILPDGYTLAHWRDAFIDMRFLSVLWRSVWLAVLVAAIDVLLVAPAVYWQRVRNPAIRPVLELLAAIPFAVPLLVIAFGLLKATGDNAPFLQGTVGLVVGAHVAVAFSFVYWAIDGSMAAANVLALTEASRTCGADLWTTIRRVILPNIGPGIASGAILAFGISFNEIAIVQVLVGSRFETVPLYTLNLLKSTDADFNILAVMTIITFFITLALSIGVVALKLGRASTVGTPMPGKAGK